MKFFQLASVFFILIAAGCSDDSNGPGTSSGNPDWLVPENQVFDGGPGKDGIPAIENPKFTTATDVDYLDKSDLEKNAFDMCTDRKSVVLA